MNLEQIKNRQERINVSLNALLEDTITVVHSIVGEQPRSDLKAETPIYLGFLGEIVNSQDISEMLISQLFEYRQILASGVYSPDVVCEQVKGN